MYTTIVLSTHFGFCWSEISHLEPTQGESHHNNHHQHRQQQQQQPKNVVCQVFLIFRFFYQFCECNMNWNFLIRKQQQWKDKQKYFTPTTNRSGDTLNISIWLIDSFQPTLCYLLLNNLLINFKRHNYNLCICVRVVRGRFLLPQICFEFVFHCFDFELIFFSRRGVVINMVVEMFNYDLFSTVVATATATAADWCNGHMARMDVYYTVHAT